MTTQTQRSATFQLDDRVKIIATSRAPRERSTTGREGRFVEYTARGYARIQSSGELLLIHPENLERVVDCAADGCGFYANDHSDYCASHG